MIRKILFGVFLLVSLVACSATHPQPESKVYDVPTDVVVIDLQEKHMVKAGVLEIEQSTGSKEPYLPFEFSVSPSAFEAFAKQLAQDGITDPSQPFSFVIIWPGDPGGSETLCDHRQTVGLQLAREVYERVYLQHFKGMNLDIKAVQERFMTMAESQVNFSFYHEARHIKHCRENTNHDQAEQEAMKAEADFTAKFGHIIFLRMIEGRSLQSAMNYVRDMSKIP